MSVATRGNKKYGKRVCLTCRKCRNHVAKKCRGWTNDEKRGQTLACFVSAKYRKVLV